MAVIANYLLLQDLKKNSYEVVLGIQTQTLLNEVDLSATILEQIQ